ncbi:DUF695 domain-containing protein [Chitinophaga sp. RCC_12]|uniref:DUF695 domain-containing protein n=1 Tax=Chitinophaga sp. RCC_12 TaxID=3239226 RepID=UPI003526BD02
MTLFKRIFGGKPQSHEAIIFTSIPQSWSVLRSENNGMPMIVRKNLGCEKIAGHSEYTTSCGIAFKILLPSAEGLPNFDLEPSLNEMEDDIFDILESDLNSIVPIVITTSRFREFVIYTKDLNEFQKRLESLRSKYSQYELTSFSKPDPNWRTYKSFN